MAKSWGRVGGPPWRAVERSLRTSAMPSTWCPRIRPPTRPRRRRCRWRAGVGQPRRLHAEWAEVSGAKAGDEFCDDAEAGKRTPIDDYGAEGPRNTAVATEAF
ncbi:MAG: hypothetical protein R3F11_27640 [Verrucomicrobiales bacterium]